jgi:hypothetical protein
MIERLMYWVSYNSQGIGVAALVLLFCGAVMLGFV